MRVYIIIKLSYARILIGSLSLIIEDRRIDDVIIKTFFNSLLYKTNRFQVAVCLIWTGCTSCASFLFLPHFDVICDLLLNRRTATWNLFVK